MMKPRRSMVVPASLSWGFVLLTGFTYVNAATGDESVHTFAAIEIGGKNVKYVRLEVTVHKDESIDVSPNGDGKIANPGLAAELGIDRKLTQAAIDRTAEIVKSMIIQLVKDHGVPANRISVVASSGIADVENLEDLRAAIFEATNGLEMHTVTAEIEVRLTMIGCVPDRDLFSSGLIDIGSSNTKWGYLEPAAYTKESPGYEVKAAFSQKGSETLSTIITEAVGNQFAPHEQFIEAAKSERTKIAEKLKAGILVPAGMDRDTVYLSGGAVWAMVTLIKPETVFESYVKLNPEDFQEYDKFLSKSKKELFEVDYDKVGSREEEQAKQELVRLKRVFEAPQIVAGGQILLAFAEHFGWNEQGSGKEILFARDGYDAWISGHVEEFARISLLKPLPLRRNWTDVGDPPRKLSAILVGYKSGLVLLDPGVDEAGSERPTIECPLENLSKLDRVFLMELSKNDAKQHFSLPLTRTWTGGSGGNRLEAAYIRKDGDHVKLLSKDGRVWHVPMSLFSSVDQDFLNNVE